MSGNTILPFSLLCSVWFVLVAIITSSVDPQNGRGTAEGLEANAPSDPQHVSRASLGERVHNNESTWCDRIVRLYKVLHGEDANSCKSHSVLSVSGCGSAADRVVGDQEKQR